jgi:glycosyltransferase involved in cell wall biosynthesis
MRGLERLAIATVGQAALRSAQVVIPINSRVAQEVEEIRPGKLGDLIPNGVDSELYRVPAAGERKLIRTARGWEERRAHMLFVGRVVPLKGADLAIEIARELGAEVELTLVGPGDPGPLPPNVTALGTLPPGEIAQLYRAADCLLLPSPAEGFPLVLQEAMASGLPAVIADNPGYKPYLQDAPRGVIQVARRQSSFVEALRAIDFGRALSTADRTSLMEFAHERFSWARCATAYEALYRQLLRTS